MKNNRGLTLVEIVISIALIGIISLGLLSAMGTNFKMLAGSKATTTFLFQAQQKMEKEAVRVKTPAELTAADVLNPKVLTFSNGIQTFERTIPGYDIDVGYGNMNAKHLKAFISPDKLPEPPVPIASVPTLTINSSSGDHVYAMETGTSLEATYAITNVNEMVSIQHVWYLSEKPKGSEYFYPIVPDSITDETDLGLKYPSDYTKINTAPNSKTFNGLGNYPGRHIVYGIRPVSKTGKIAKEELSKPVWIIGLPVINNLKVHLDASMVPLSVPVDSPVPIWTNLASSLSSMPAGDAGQGTVNKQPVLKDMDLVKYFQFDGVDDVMSIANTSNLNMNKGTIFIVANSADHYSFFNPIVSKHSSLGSWGLGWIDSNNLGFYMSATPGVNDTRQISSGLDSKWHVLRAVTGGNGSAMSYAIDGNPPDSANRNVVNISNTNSITIGGGNSKYSKVGIAEVLIYDTNLSSTQITAVETYLKKKYSAFSIPLPGQNAFLNTLSLLPSGTLSPSFAPRSIFQYDVVVPSGLGVPVLKPTKSCVDSVMSTTDASTFLNGKATSKVVVTAQDGSKNTYVVNFSADDTLKSLKVCGRDLDLSAGVLDHTITLDPNETTPVLSDVVGVAAGSGATASSSIAVVGDTRVATIEVLVGGVVKRTYTVTINQPSRLSALTNNRGPFNPVFDPSNSNTGYILTYASTGTFTITPTATSLPATITVNGVAVASGTQSPQFAKGLTVTIVVTENGKSPRTYVIN